MEAIRVLKECEFENRFATPDEQIILSKYVGWGGLPEAFDENNTSWADEYKELYTALSPEEYATASESVLTAFILLLWLYPVSTRQWSRWAFVTEIY